MEKETAKNNNKNRVKIPQSKLNYDNKITKATMLTANELNAEIDAKLDELGKSKKGGSKMDVISDMMSS